MALLTGPVPDRVLLVEGRDDRHVVIPRDDSVWPLSAFP